jgi:putative methionine-R-sulfoxide reductase with GAF domain/HAMP domain-containing protein
VFDNIPISREVRIVRPRTPLGRKMSVALSPLVLIPLVLMAATAYFRSRAIVRDLVAGQLTWATQSQVALVQDWEQTRERQLFLASQRGSLRHSGGELLQMRAAGNAAVLENARAELEDSRAAGGGVLFSDILVAELASGRILAATQPAYEGQALSALLMAQGTAVRTLPVVSDPLFGEGSLAILSIVPMRSADTMTPDLMLVGVNSGLRVGQLIVELRVFSEQRGVFLIERGQTALLLRPDVQVQLERYTTDPTVQTGTGHPALEQPETSEAQTLEYDNADAVPVIGAYQWIPDWGMMILNELPQAEVYGGLATLAPFTAGLLAASAVVSVILISSMTRRLLRPLSTVTEFAGRMSRGDWQARLPEDRDDELGVLSAALNRMAEDLSGTYQTLETRVEERTLQVRTAAEVARAVISIPDLETLMRRAVDLIRERFGYYHVSIFLVDDPGEFAVLRASTGEVGAALIARGHRLGVGSQSIIGSVTAANQPRVASDVASDAIHLRNELLPATRSEAAVPLQVGGRVLGALDVQSIESDAFSPEDIAVLQTLADQLSAAILNARLAQTSAAAAERAKLISDVTSRVTGLLQMDDVLEATAQVLYSALGRPDVTIQLVPPGGPPSRGEESEGA